MNDELHKKVLGRRKNYQSGVILDMRTSHKLEEIKNVLKTESSEDCFIIKKYSSMPF